jgi:hypothetical protein
MCILETWRVALKQVPGMLIVGAAQLRWGVPHDAVIGRGCGVLG